MVCHGGATSQIPLVKSLAQNVLVAVMQSVKNKETRSELRFLNMSWKGLICVLRAASRIPIESGKAAWGEMDSTKGLFGKSLVELVVDVAQGLETALRANDQGEFESTLKLLRFLLSPIKKTTEEDADWSRAYGMSMLSLYGTLYAEIANIVDSNSTRERLEAFLTKIATATIHHAPDQAAIKIVEHLSEGWESVNGEKATSTGNLFILSHLVSHSDLRGKLMRNVPDLPVLVQAFMRGLRSCYATVLMNPYDERSAKDSIYSVVYRALAACFLQWPASDRKAMDSCLLQWSFVEHPICSAISIDVWCCLLRLGPLKNDDTIIRLIFNPDKTDTHRRPSSDLLTKALVHVYPHLSSPAKNHLGRWVARQLDISGDLTGAACVLTAVSFKSIPQELHAPIARQVREMIPHMLTSTTGLQKHPERVAAIAGESHL